VLGRLLLVDVSDFSQTEYLVTQLHAQGKRIEKLSKLEHDLIKEVHPQVSEIKAGMDTVVSVVKDNAETILSKPAAQLQ
jgi:hypothetical protein